MSCFMTYFAFNFFHPNFSSLALSVLLNTTCHYGSCVLLAEEQDAVDLLVDLLQMFRDIRSIFCLTSEILCRLVDSALLIHHEVS
jgi:hypothetical protein